MFRVLFLIVLVAFRILDLVTTGDCPDGRCPNARPVTYEWRRRADDDGRIYLFANGVQIGGWSYTDKHFRSYEPATRSWGPPQPTSPAAVPDRDPPKPLPVGAVAGEDNYGIDLERLAASCKGERCYRINGREVSREQAFAALDDGLPNDQDWLRITFVGDRAVGEQIKADVLKEPLRSAGRFVVQCYDSVDDPMIRGLGFTSNALWIQSPQGQVLHGQTGYAGPESLAAAMTAAEGLRRKDPKFDPKLIPDLLRKTDEPRPLDGLRDMSAATGWIKQNWLNLVVCGWAVWYLTIRRRTPTQ